MTVFIQILLVTVILVLTALVVISGFQVFHILHELRLALQKLNRILDNTNALSEASAKPVIAVNEFFSGVKTLVNQTEEEMISATPDRVVMPRHLGLRERFSRRFFHRSGAPLRPLRPS